MVAPARPVCLLFLMCLAAAGWAFSFGLGTQLTSHWLNSFHTNTIIGLNHATYYLGIALASLLAPKLIRRWGRQAAVLGMVLCGLTLALFPLGNNLLCWFGLRFLNGVGSALSLVTLETGISLAALPQQRTRNFGFYAVALTLAGAMGIWAGLHLYTPGQILPFLAGGLSALAGGVLVLLSPGWPTAHKEETNQAPLDLQENYLSLGTAWCQGFLEGGLLAFLSLYLLSLGLSADAAGGLMSLAMVGVILFQVPVSWLGDRLGLTPTLLGCYTVVLVCLLSVPVCGSALWLGLSLFMLGACSAAMYPLGLGLLGQRVPEGGLAKAYAWYLAMDCLGSQVGSAAMGQARDWWGQGAMFPVGAAALVLVLTSWSVVARRREKTPYMLGAAAVEPPRRQAAA